LGEKVKHLTDQSNFIFNLFSTSLSGFGVYLFFMKSFPLAPLNANTRFTIWTIAMKPNANHCEGPVNKVKTALVGINRNSPNNIWTINMSTTPKSILTLLFYVL
jgi:hypothetical protein